MVMLQVTLSFVLSLLVLGLIIFLRRTLFDKHQKKANGQQKGPSDKMIRQSHISEIPLIAGGLLGFVLCFYILSPELVLKDFEHLASHAREKFYIFCIMALLAYVCIVRRMKEWR